MFSNETIFLTTNLELRTTVHQSFTLVDIPVDSEYERGHMEAQLTNAFSDSKPMLVTFPIETSGRWLPFFRALSNSDLAVLAAADDSEFEPEPALSGIPVIFDNRVEEILSRAVANISDTSSDELEATSAMNAEDSLE